MFDDVEGPRIDAGERFVEALRREFSFTPICQQTTRRLLASSTVQPSLSSLIKPSRSSVSAVSASACPEGRYLDHPVPIDPLFNRSYCHSFYLRLTTLLSLFPSTMGRTWRATAAMIRLSA